MSTTPAAYGKARKRPLRRPPATPYDRPPSAARGLRPLPVAAADQNATWLSKLVDPASRIIARGASRIFSSMFRKSLASPPAAPDEKHLSNPEANAVSHSNPSLEVGEQGGNDADNKANYIYKDGAKQEESYDTDKLFEVEQLLKRKTFTRAEFNHLSELVRTRTVEPSTLEPIVTCENKANATVLRQESGIRTIKPTDVEEEYRSYMGPRRSKESSPALSFRNGIFKKDNDLPCNNGKTGSNLLPTRRSVVRFSGIPEVPNNDYYISPKTVGRSAMHRMSCSPYFKASSLTGIKGGELHRESNVSPSASSQWMLTNFMQSGDKPVHKRSSSVLDDDFGSSGSMRRIRRKSNLMSPLKDMQSTHSGTILPTPMLEDIGRWLAVPIQNPVCLDSPEDESRNLKKAENGDAKDPFRCSLSSPHSTEVKRVTLQQLDKPVTSPKEKSPVPGSVARDVSPYGLTVNMLNQQALKSMKDIDSSKFLYLPSSYDQDVPSDSDALSLRNSDTQPPRITEANTPSEPIFSGVKAIQRTEETQPPRITEANTPSEPVFSGVKAIQRTEETQPPRITEANTPSEPVFSGVKATQRTEETVSVISTTGANPGLRTADFAISGSATVTLPEEPAFRMTAPEDLWDLDDDDSSSEDTPNSVSIENGKPEQKKLEGLSKTSETKLLEKSLASSSGSLPTFGSMLNKEADTKASNGLATVNNTGLPFLVPPAPITFSQSPPTPSGSSSFSASQNEHITANGSVFGSKNSHASADSVIVGNNNLDPDKLEGKTGAYKILEKSLPSSSGSVPTFGSVLNTEADMKASNTPAPGKDSGFLSITFSQSSPTPLVPSPSSNRVAPESEQFVAHGSVFSSKEAPSPVLPKATGINDFASLKSNASTVATVAVLGGSNDANSLAVGDIFKPSENAASPTVSTVTSPIVAAFGASNSSSSSLAPIATSSFQSSSSQTSASPIFGSSTSSPSTGFSFGQSAITSNSQPSTTVLSSSTSVPTTGFSFGQSAPTSTQPSSASVLGSSATSPSTGLLFGQSAPASNFKLSSASPSTGFSFGQSTPATSSLLSSSVFGSGTSSSSTGLAFGPASSSQPLSSSDFGSSTSASTGFQFGQSAPASTLSSSVFGSGTTLSTTGFTFGTASSSQTSSSSLFGSITSASTGFQFGQSAPAPSSQPTLSSSQPFPSVFGSGTSSSSAGFTFGSASSSQPSSSSSIFCSTTSPATGFQFGQSISASSAQPSTSSIFGSSTSSTNTSLPFGPSVTTPTSSTFVFGTSSSSAFSFPSAGTSTFASSTQPVFGSPAPIAGFSSGFSGSSQVNMEDSMADDTNQAVVPMVPTFGQPTNSVATPNFSFGSPAIPTGGSSVFQFGSQQNPSVPQSPSPFQAGGSLDFSGGSFSLGSTGGGDKAGRKIVKINRSKLRKK